LRGKESLTRREKDKELLKKRDNVQPMKKLLAQKLSVRQQTNTVMSKNVCALSKE
jgi:hypothetical protein